MNSSKSTIISTDSSVCASSDRNRWVWGFTPQAEIWNGRLAMLGFSSVVVIAYLYRQGVLH
jgi:Chlorophyll A-B binding protein